MGHHVPNELHQLHYYKGSLILVLQARLGYSVAFVGGGVFPSITLLWVRFSSSCVAHTDSDESCAETRFGLSGERTSPFESAGVSFQSLGRRLYVHIVW
jgi:hypothetical protein